MVKAIPVGWKCNLCPYVFVGAAMVQPNTFSFGFHRKRSVLQSVNLSQEDMALVSASFDDLSKDPWYVVMGGNRFRRFKRFHLSVQGWQYQSDQSFQQSKAYNSVVGDIPRSFEPIAEDVLKTGILEKLAHQQATTLGLNLADYNLGVHQFRVSITGGFDGTSTPEGIHQDGHDFVCIVHWRSENISGAASRVYDAHKKKIFECPLRGMGETLYVNDRTHYHDVSPLACCDSSKPGLREVFVFDWNLKG